MALLTNIKLGLERETHSSLLQKFVNYGRKKFYNIGPSIQFGSLNNTFQLMLIEGPIIRICSKLVCLPQADISAFV
jgi:hypothetical protein